MISWLLLWLLSWALIKPVDNLEFNNYRYYRRQIIISECDENTKARGLAFTKWDLIMICSNLEPEIFEAVLYHELWHIYAQHRYREYIVWEKWRIEWFANAFSYIFTNQSLWHTLYPKIMKNVLLRLWTNDFNKVLEDNLALRTILKKPIIVWWKMYNNF